MTLVTVVPSHPHMLFVPDCLKSLATPKGDLKTNEGVTVEVQYSLGNRQDDLGSHNWKEEEKSRLGSASDGTSQSPDWLSQVFPKSLGHLYHHSYHSMFVPGSGRLFVVLSIRPLDPLPLLFSLLNFSSLILCNIQNQLFNLLSI